MIRWLQAISAASILLTTIPLPAAEWEKRTLEGDAARRQGDYATAVNEFRALVVVPEADLGTTLLLLADSYVQWIEAILKQRGDPKRIIDAAIQDLLPFAEKQNAEAQYWLGRVYEKLTLDYGNRKSASREALKWYVKAAEQDHAYAQWRLGGVYKTGAIGLEETLRDYYQARKWYESAANKGHDGAMLDLGELYAEGKGVARDYSRAVQWFQKAIKQGNRSALVALGSMYETGRGVPRDENEATKLYQEAANHGNFFAKLVIEARALAEKDDPSGQYRFGNAWIDGIGVVQDVEEGRRWLEKSAEQKHVPAIYRLGKLYLEGFGVPRDFVLAYQWFNIAAFLGDDAAKRERDKLAGIMTPFQIADGQKRAREWMTGLQRR